MTTVHYWADGTWCYKGDLEKYLNNGMSDDYGTIDFTIEDSIDEDKIELHVRYALGDFKAFEDKYQKNSYDQSTLNNQLLDACEKGDLEEVKNLVNLGADIHQEKELPLWYASEHGHLEVVEYLVENDADIHCHNDYALYAASDGGHLKTVEFLIKVGANVNARDGYILYEAARQDHLDVVKCLVENGARMDKAVCSIVEFDNPKIIDYLEQKEQKSNKAKAMKLQYSIGAGSGG